MLAHFQQFMLGLKEGWEYRVGLLFILSSICIFLLSIKFVYDEITSLNHPNIQLSKTQSMQTTGREFPPVLGRTTDIPQLNLQLRGIVLGKRPADNIAILLKDNQEVLLHAGDTIAPKVTLVTVNTLSVTISNHGKLLTLEIPWKQSAMPASISNPSNSNVQQTGKPFSLMDE